MMSPRRSAIATAMSSFDAPALAIATMSSTSCTSSRSVALNLTSRSATLSGTAGRSWMGRRYIAFMEAMRAAKGRFIDVRAVGSGREGYCTLERASFCGCCPLERLHVRADAPRRRHPDLAGFARAGDRAQGAPQVTQAMRLPDDVGMQRDAHDERLASRLGTHLLELVDDHARESLGVHLPMHD